MAVFDTLEEREYFKDALRAMYGKNEASPDQWYVFSDAVRANSTWSFGQIQWDVGRNPAARSILGSLKDSNGTSEFSPEDIEKLSKEKPMAAGDIERYNEILSWHSEEIDGYFEQRLNADVTLIENIVSELRYYNYNNAGDYIASNPLIQLMLIDYNNQLVTFKR